MIRLGFRPPRMVRAERICAARGGVLLDRMWRGEDDVGLECGEERASSWRRASGWGLCPGDPTSQRDLDVASRRDMDRWTHSKTMNRSNQDKREKHMQNQHWTNKKNIKSAYQQMKELPLELGIHPNNHNLATLILLYIAHSVLQWITSFRGYSVLLSMVRGEGSFYLAMDSGYIWRCADVWLFWNGHGPILGTMELPHPPTKERRFSDEAGLDGERWARRSNPHFIFLFVLFAFACKLYCKYGVSTIWGFIWI